MSSMTNSSVSDISDNSASDTTYLYSNHNSWKNDNTVKIPKIIMQTWKDHNIPKKWKSSPISIKKYMPDWKYVLMTDKDNRNFVKKHFPDFLKYYDAFPYPIQKCDAVRYCWLFIHGGLYMDLDFEVLHPLDSLFTTDNEVYLVNSGNFGSYLTNSFMASKPGCKLWLDVIESMKKTIPYYYVGRHLTVMQQTGPLMLTETVKESKIVYGMLPVRLISPCSVCNIGCLTEGAYLKQLEGSSWISYDTKCYIFFMCNYKQLILAIVLILLVILIALFFQWMEFV